MLFFISQKLEGLAYRLELLGECRKLKASGRLLPQQYKSLCFRAPSTYDDFINFLCFIDNKKTVNLIDIGANIGKFTTDFFKFFPHSDKILCIEPIPNLINQIKKNTNDKRVKVINAALGSKQEKLTLRYPKADTTLASLHSYNNDVNQFYKIDETIAEEVEVLKLDDIASDFSKESNFIVKIDTQGHEIEVIKGGLQTLSRASIVLLECSFVKEYLNLTASFAEATKLLAEVDLFPVIFQRHGKKISTYAFERDVIFVKSNLLPKIFHKNYTSSPLLL